MIWTYIIWIASLGFTASSGVENLKEGDVIKHVSGSIYYTVNNDVFYSEEDALDFTFDVLTPEINYFKNIFVAEWFYGIKPFANHSKILNPLKLDLPPPACSLLI